MTEVTEDKKHFVTVVFPSRQWSMKEAAAFEEFIRFNGTEIRRIFIKYGTMTGR